MYERSSAINSLKRFAIWPTYFIRSVSLGKLAVAPVTRSHNPVGGSNVVFSFSREAH